MALNRERWTSLWTAVSPRKGRDPFAGLAQRYAEPHRHYHDARHIEACLAGFDDIRSHVAHPVALELAIWFHDAVCDPRATDNEEQSARLAGEAIEHGGGRDDLRERVERLILATKRHEVGGDPDAAWMIDIDLAVLGAAPAVFDAYDAAIRREYAWFEPGVFAEKRAVVLEQFLARPAIYVTDHFRERFEHSARENLTRAIARLRGVTRS